MCDEQHTELSINRHESPYVQPNASAHLSSADVFAMAVEAVAQTQASAFGNQQVQHGHNVNVASPHPDVSIRNRTMANRILSPSQRRPVNDLEYTVYPSHRPDSNQQQEHNGSDRAGVNESRFLARNSRSRPGLQNESHSRMNTARTKNMEDVLKPPHSGFMRARSLVWKRASDIFRRQSSNAMPFQNATAANRNAHLTNSLRCEPSYFSSPNAATRQNLDMPERNITANAQPTVPSQPGVPSRPTVPSRPLLSSQGNFHGENSQSALGQQATRGTSLHHCDTANKETPPRQNPGARKGTPPANAARRTGTVRGRVCGSASRSARARGRGRNQGGGRRKAPEKENAVEGWQMGVDNTHEVVLEDELMDTYFTQHTRLFLTSAMERLTVELQSKKLQATGSGVLILFADQLLMPCVQCFNKHIFLRQMKDLSITRATIYEYMAVMLYSQCSAFSFDRTLEVLRTQTVRKLNGPILKFINRNILAYSSVGRGKDSSLVWNEQRDQTVMLGQFERKAFDVSGIVFLVPDHTICSLDDDLMRTIASDNQQNTISNRKADRKGHTVDVISDALFRVVLQIRFARQGEKLIQGVRKLLSSLLDSRGQRCLQGIVVALNRGSARQEVLMELSSHV